MSNGSGDRVSTTNEASDNRFLGWWRTISGAIVVILALAALVFCTIVVIHHFGSTVCEKVCIEERAEGKNGVGTQNATASASSIAAVMTPIVTAILGIAGLFFGIAASGAAKARQAEASENVAASNAEAQVAAHATAQLAFDQQAGRRKGRGPFRR